MYEQYYGMMIGLNGMMNMGNFGLLFGGTSLIGITLIIVFVILLTKSSRGKIR